MANEQQEVKDEVVVAPAEEKAEAKTADRKPREGEEQGAPRRRRPQQRRKVCQFCVDKIEEIDYKDVAKLRRFITEKGKIISRRQTGTCAKHQRALANAIKRARYMGLIHYVGE
ncbi:MAG: 30S ribosomal protein S18 [Clostridia bacterium]|nr:30S ribosomal protein S18 [Clostridia bacterium]